MNRQRGDGRASSYDEESDYLSDDEFDTISGGIPHSAAVSGSAWR
jgi:hypothetical protein